MGRAKLVSRGPHLAGKYISKVQRAGHTGLGSSWQKFPDKVEPSPKKAKASNKTTAVLKKRCPRCEEIVLVNHLDLHLWLKHRVRARKGS
jgi:hypothetical protein